MEKSRTKKEKETVAQIIPCSQECPPNTEPVEILDAQGNPTGMCRCVPVTNNKKA